ncbi:hypothetical protein PF008_g7941 [Phytophthora fragariae]|uniref:Uncharacterized protein n=1 Tax=Phytophthora fragariae TaxID=53985 RepID=A0A6G0S193_9STRA|nr:hypothetical protein PF008_g7941 [Phytophthora fragariae]
MNAGQLPGCQLLLPSLVPASTPVCRSISHRRVPRSAATFQGLDPAQRSPRRGARILTDDDDEEALLSSDNADADEDDHHNEQASQERVDARSNRVNRLEQMNHCLDYSYEYLGIEF